MIKRIFNLIAILSMFVFSIGIHPTCSSVLYQQELPDELK